MAKPENMELGDGTIIPIVYEDRSTLAIDKPAGWMLVPTSWERAARNLQLAIESSIAAGDFWAMEMAGAFQCRLLEALGGGGKA